MSELEFAILAKALTDSNIEKEKLKQKIAHLEAMLAEALTKLDKEGLL